MNVFGKSFTFDNVSSDNYHIMLCSLESSNDNKRNSSISYDILCGDINPSRPISNFYFKKYQEPLRFTIEVCRICGGRDRFTTEEQQEIIRWITSPRDFRKFEVIDFDDENYHKNIEYYCMCVDYGETVINGIVCLRFDFQCNAPYGFQKEEVTSFTATGSKTSVNINNVSDELEYDYYPIIELKGTATGEVRIKNTIYPNDEMILQVKNGQTLIIDCDMSDISDNTDTFNYSTDTNLKWLKLAHGINTIEITGNVVGSIKTQYPRKVGI